MTASRIPREMFRNVSVGHARRPSFLRDATEEALALISLGLFIATVLLWVEIIGSKIQ